MKLNHESYKKAFSGIRMEHTGAEFLHDSKIRQLHRRKKIMSQVAAAIICIVIAGGAGTGICYAQTGTDPIHFLTTLFRYSSAKAAEQLADGFVESGQIIKSDNIQVSLDSYYYDKENGIILSNVTVSTMDGTDFYTDADRLKFGSAQELAGWTDEEIMTAMLDADFDVHSGADNCSGTHVYKIENGHTFHAFAMICDMNGSKNTSDQLIVRGTNDTGVLGTFTLEPTGALKTVDLNVKKLGACDKAEINGGYLKVSWKEASEERTLPEIPFSKAEVKMKDGSIYRYEKPDPEWERKGNHEMDEKELAYYEEEENVTKIFGMSIFSNSVSGDNECMIGFPDFIDVDDVISVVIDGVEVLP